MSLKDLISSPLEAGTSILDAHNLPPHLLPALEYASARLARKSIHVTLIAVRRDYQLPPVLPPHGAPGLPSPITPGTPTLSRLHSFASSPVYAFKQLVRSTSSNSLSPSRSFEGHKNGWGLYPGVRPSIDTPSPRLRWLPSPGGPLSPPPMTPSTSASSTTSESVDGSPSGSFGMRLVYTGTLRPKDAATLNAVVKRAMQAYGIESEWLSTPVGPAACGFTKQLIQSSVLQNEVLFTSEGLTLLSLDRLYSLKGALSSYHKTRSKLRLEDAVDELRRLILSRNGEKVARSDLLRSYDWLAISGSSISELDRMYRRAYGGVDQISPISGMSTFAERMRQEPEILSDDAAARLENGGSEEETIGIALTTYIGKTPSPKAPALKLQTDFLTPAKPILLYPEETDDAKGEDEDDDDNDGDLTARPTERLPIMLQPWNSTSIDQVLSADVISPGASSMKMGPMTPNGYDDISPTTRGEWGFMMGDNALGGGRTVGIETW